MNLNSLPTILGFSAASLISPALMAVSAQAATFQLNSGVTNVILNTTTLSGVGLELTGTNGIVIDPALDVPTGFALAGFPITPATNFTFSDANGLTPLGGTIEHSGTITFNNSVTVGNFSIGFDPSRVGRITSGFFVRDTASLGAVLFDVAPPSRLALTSSTISLAASLLVSAEFAGFLGNAALTGAEVGSASIEGQISEVAAVPEPTTVLGAIAAGSLFVASRRNRNKQANSDR